VNTALGSLLRLRASELAPDRQPAAVEKSTQALISGSRSASGSHGAAYPAV